MRKEDIIKEVFGKIMVQFNYNEFKKTHPKLLECIMSVMEVSSIQAQLATKPGINKQALLNRASFTN